MKLADRVAALESDLLPDDGETEPILVRTRSGCKGGELFPDSRVSGLRGSDGKVAQRLPGEELAALAIRAAAAAPPGHPRRRLVHMCMYAAA